MVPLGWVVGCPLLGWISDLKGKRKPVISVGILIMMMSFSQLIYVPTLMPAVISMLIFGIASGAAMLPYSIIKEANPDHVKGSATGGINFLTFGITAILGPTFGKLYGKTLETVTDHETHFTQAGNFMLLVMGAALIASLIIRETGQKRLIKPHVFRG
ncbi:hypothetical protein [Pedobacter jamesrossensis]